MIDRSFVKAVEEVGVGTACGDIVNRGTIRADEVL